MSAPTTQRNITDPKFMFPLMAIFLVLMVLPEVITWLTIPNDLIFNGAFINITDFNVYLSAIRQGAEGNWLFSPQFTPETFPPYLSFLPYILAGKLMALLGGSSILWYQILRFLSWAVVIYAFIHLIETVFPLRNQLQRTALILLMFGSGIGWLMLMFFGKLTLHTPDLFLPEWNLITASYAAPHFLLGIALQAAYFSSFIKLTRRSETRQILVQGGIGVGLSLVYPYQIVVNGLVLVSYFILRAIEKRKIPWQEILVTGAVSIPMVAALIYYGYILPRNPTYKEVIVTNNEIIPPPLTGILIGFGILLILAFFGSQKWLDKGYSKVILIWFPANLIAIYLPFSFSGRFLTGLFIPVCLVAALGLEEVVLPRVGKDQRLSPQRLRNIILAATVPSTILFVTYFFLVVNSFDTFPYYNRVDTDESAKWLAQITTEDDLALAEFPFNNLLPRYGKGRVFHGHFDLTVDLEGRFKIMEAFWSPETSDEWRRAFIKEWGFTYLYQGFYENAHNDGSPLQFPYEVIYQTDQVTIYRLP